MSVIILHTPFDPARIPMRRPSLGPMGWADYRDPAPQMAGWGRFLKKAAKTVTKVARAPIKLIAPKLEKKLEKLDNKIIDNIDSVHTKINMGAQSVGKWAKKNAKWIIIAAAIAVTIYTMGAGAGFMAKFTAGLAKVKATIGAGGAWMKAKGLSLLSAMSRLQGGAKMGELPPEEVQALAEANAGTGENLVPIEIMSRIIPDVGIPGGVVPETGGPSWITQAMPALETVAQLAKRKQSQLPSFVPEPQPMTPIGPGSGGGGSTGGFFGTSSPGGGLPGWVMPAAIGAGALVLFMTLKR